MTPGDAMTLFVCCHFCHVDVNLLECDISNQYNKVVKVLTS